MTSTYSGSSLGVYGSGKSKVAAEMAYLLEQAGEPTRYGLEHVAISNDRPVTVIAREIMADAGWA